MGVADDIADAYSEVGIGYTILLDSGNWSGEYMYAKPNSQITKPFIREFFLEVQMPWNTSGEAGDLTQIDITGDVFMVANKTADIFENQIIEYSTVWYKCNASGEILRPSGEIWDSQSYHKTQQWEVISSNAYSLYTEPLFGNRMVEENLGALDIQRDELYIPKTYNIQTMDRFQPKSGEYYMVNNVKRNRFPAIDVCELVEDER